jgi:hypothetical protein
MSLISRFLKKIFGNKKDENEKIKQSNNFFITKWQNERKARINEAEQNLKDWLISLVNDKKSLQFSWESGNDEAFVSFQDYKEIDEEKFQDLEEYIIDKLEIPDAGEFQMNGKGTIYLENNYLKVKYSSIMKATIDFNEETEEEIFSEEEQDNGEKNLFAV